MIMSTARKSRLRKFVELDARDKRLFVEAYARLGLMRAAVSTVSFKRLSRSLHQLKDGQAPAVNSSQRDMALSIGRAVRRAAAATPWQSTCLVQVLAAQRMLSKRGIGGVIYLGAMVDADIEAGIRAHAWLKCGDYFVTGEEGHEAYPVLTCYGW
jgi:hypothetical protein